MKPLYFAAPLLAAFSLGSLAAAAQDSLYVSDAGRPTSRQLASYFQIMAHTDSGWAFADHWMNGHLKITGRISEDMKHRLGTFTWYDSAGVMVKRCKYVGHGGAIETHFYSDGQVMLQGPTLQEQRTGEWTSYYSSGKVKAIGNYSEGQLDTASFFNEDGTPNNTMTIFWRESDYPGGAEAYKIQPVIFTNGNLSPSNEADYDKTFTKVEIESCFPGGDRGWLLYLTNHLRYPREAVYNRIQGTVIVQFIVDKQGNVTDVQAIGGTEFGGLRQEAVRVIKNSGKWTPAIQNGRQVKSYKHQPIIFKLD